MKREENKDREINLQWAQHQEWFEKYHIYRDEFLNNLSGALYIDSNLKAKALQSLNKYLMCVDSQIELLEDPVKFEKDEQTLLELYKGGHTIELLTGMKKVFKKAEKILMKLKINPNPEIEEKPDTLTSDEDKIKIAAWEKFFDKDEISNNKQTA